MPKYHTKHYQDSVEGCKDFIAYETVLKVTPDTTFEPDPAVAGVWRVRFLATRRKRRGEHVIILYMAGYKDPWSKIRETNDFEEVEP